MGCNEVLRVRPRYLFFMVIKDLDAVNLHLYDIAERE